MKDQIIQNTSDTIDINIYSNGVLTDPTDNEVTVTITNPNSVAIYSDSAATKTATGKYQFTVNGTKTDILGTYTALWSFTLDGSNIIHSQEFEVVTTVDNNYLIPKEYKALTSFDLTDYNDNQLKNYLNRASLLIDSYLGGSTRKQSYSESVRCILDIPNNGFHIQLNHAPVGSVTSVTIRYEQKSTISLNVTNIRVNEKAGYLEYFGGGSNRIDYNACVRDLTTTKVTPFAEVVYEAGYDEIPEQIERATARLTDQLINMETKEFKDVSSLSDSGYSESYNKLPGQLDIGRIGNDEIVELLRDYRHPVKRNIKIM